MVLSYLSHTFAISDFLGLTIQLAQNHFFVLGLFF